MSRQYNEKGNPFKRGNTWTIIYYVYENGSRKQKWKGGFETKAEATKALSEYKAKIVLKQYITNSNITVESYLTSWFEHHKKVIEPSTANGYRVNIYNHIIPQIGNIKLSNLKAADIENMCLDLQKNKHLSGKTIKYVYNVLKVALKEAVNNKLIETNVALQAKTPKVAKYKATVLSPEQLNILFSAVKNTTYETEIKLAAVLGLRRGEVLGIRNQDINYAQHTISIEQQVSVTKVVSDKADKNKLFNIKDLKSDCSHRTIFISKDVEDLIKRRQIYNQSQKSKLGENYIDKDLLCCKDNGDIISPQTLYHAFKRVLKECDLPSIRFHDLRHSYATMLIDLNIPIKVISQNLGHSSTAVTDMIYADSISAKKNVSNTVSSLLNCG